MKLKEIGLIVSVIVFFALMMVIHRHTHDYAKGATVSTALDMAEKNEAVKRPTSYVGLDLYPREALNVVAVESSKRTVDFIVNKMIEDKFIIVNKDGESYRFKLVKKYKQIKDNK